VLLDIRAGKKPKPVSQTKFQARHKFDVHTVSPDFKRKLVYVNSEAVISDCKGPLDHATIVDVSNPAQPFAVSRFPVPVPPAGLPYKNFCDKGGRFGPHNMNQLQYNPNVQQQGNLAYLTWFNAGLRAVDIRDPYHPKEIGYYIPAMNKNTVVLETPATQRGKVNATAASDRMAIQSNNVDVDDRGYVYVVDRANSGMHILQLTGSARAIANWPKK